MTRMSTIATAAAMTLVLGLPANTAAQQPDTRDRTIMTFSAPVELPGMRLAAGTYVFRLADTATRNVIQVLSRDDMEMLGQWLFIPAERRDVTSETVVTFRETSAGSTPAVQYWFYPGESIGKEFIYPKDQALKIAQRTGVAVRAEDGVVEGGGIAAVETPAPSVQAEAAVTPAPAPAPRAEVAVQAEREPVAVQAEASAAPQAEVFEQPRAVGTSGAAELPATASPLALSGLLGLLSLAGAAALRKIQ